jgi:hypothetical protein
VRIGVGFSPYPGGVASYGDLHPLHFGFSPEATMSKIEFVISMNGQIPSILVRERSGRYVGNLVSHLHHIIPELLKLRPGEILLNRIVLSSKLDLLDRAVTHGIVTPPHRHIDPGTFHYQWPVTRLLMVPADGQSLVIECGDL